MIAEKFEAMIRLGEVNSRFKDFYDLWSLCREFSFDGDTLSRAVAATFARRKTSPEETEPVALSNTYGASPDNQKQWTAFLRRSGLEANSAPFTEVVENLRTFLLPVWMHVRSNSMMPSSWPRGGPWKHENRLA